MIRIIAGEYRGRRLQAPKNLPVRPTTDRAKEGLFNILEHRLQLSEIVALDLFSGTGNLAYELISRGTPDVTAVDQDRNCIRFINETIEKLGFTGLISIRAEIDKFLKSNRRTYDLILADPPYDYHNYDQLLELIFGGGNLKPAGLLIIEHESRVQLNDHPRFEEVRKYGNSSFSFFGASEQGL